MNNTSFLNPYSNCFAYARLPQDMKTFLGSAVSPDFSSYYTRNPACEALSFSCEDITDVPQSECEALVDIYDANNGPQWASANNRKVAARNFLCTDY